MDNGHVIEQGSHEELVARRDGLYARLHAMSAAPETLETPVVEALASAAETKERS